MNDLWRGSWATRARIASGLVLFAYALTHFVNIGLGLISPVWMDAAQAWRQVVTRSILGTTLIYGAFAIHMSLAFWKLATRGTLRMPLWEVAQNVLGIIIPILLVAHVLHTRTAHEFYEVNDEMGYIMLLIYDTADGWKQSALLLVVWVHGWIGLHFWLRGKRWWQNAQSYLIGVAVLIPAAALAGFLVEGRRVSAVFDTPEGRDALIAQYNFPTVEIFRNLISITDQIRTGTYGVLAVAAIAYVARYVRRRRRSVRISYGEAQAISAPKGLTLLEMSRLRGVPHASLCGGRGRCTTCRVIVEEGAETLAPPSPAEAATLKAVNADPGTRLACQIKPVAPLKVFRVYAPDGRSRSRGHASEGEEKELAVLFLDMRGFTARTTGQLPYDVVFLLNRFFDAVVPSINAAGGKVDKYLGDGFLALFETPDERSSARAALRAVEGISRALEAFNERLRSEGAPPVAIGIGAHLGNVVLGEIGAAGEAPRTLIGDTVNTASRLEGMTKEHQVQAFISKPLLRAADIDLSRKELVELELRGVAHPLAALPIKDARNLDKHLQAP
ncbi:MAG: adenylate/guanylate cyclase domain-containing protein [Pseudomonadota bacterium]